MSESPTAKKKKEKTVIIDVYLSALLNKTTHKSNLALPGQADDEDMTYWLSEKG